MVEVRSFWLAGPIVQKRVPDTLFFLGAVLHAAVWALDFGVTVKMRGAH